MATPPRYVVPGRTLHLAVQAVNRQFRFVPRQKVVDSIRFIFWYCVKKYGIAVHDANWMSNHSHLAMTDVRGVFPKFMCEMNSLISRQLNALRSEVGTNIEKGYSCNEISDDESMLRTCGYILANPCLADLVERAVDWKSVCTYEYEYGVPFVVQRPKCGMWSEQPRQRKRRKADSLASERHAKRRRSSSGGESKAVRRRHKPSKLPEQVEGKLTRPNVCPELSDEELRQAVRARTAQEEQAAALKRKAKQKKVLGWTRVTRRQPNTKPRKRQEIFQIKPLVAASSTEQRHATLEEIFRFRQEYYAARDIYIHRDPRKAVFPRGTWKMRVELNARCRS